jgi:hypothetical protein
MCAHILTGCPARSGSQRRCDLRVREHAAGPAQVAASRALGHPGAVDQPRGGTVVGVFGVALPGGERAQEPGPGGSGDGVGLLEGVQALGLRLGGERGGVGSGQVAQAGQDHVHRFGGIAGSRSSH